MAESEKYEKVDAPDVGEGESLSILRAQDKLAEANLELYWAMVASYRAPRADKHQKKLTASV